MQSKDWGDVVTAGKTKMADKSQESDSELQSSDSQDDQDELRNLDLNKGGTFVHSLGGKGLVAQLKHTAENVIIIKKG